MPQSTKKSAVIEFEPEFIAGLKDIFENSIVFNRTLGLKITQLTPQRAVGRIDMRHELVGHPAYNRIHGGVISAGLDAMGGLAVMAAIGARHMDESPLERLHRFSKLGTIDLRIDYLRPGIGEYFELRAEVMRLGSRVASTRMEFFGADGTLLSTGSGAYSVSGELAGRTKSYAQRTLLGPQLIRGHAPARMPRTAAPATAG